MRSYITFSTIRIYDVNSSPLQFWFMDYKPCNKQQWYNGVSSTVNINSMTWEFKLKQCHTILLTHSKRKFLSYHFYFAKLQRYLILKLVGNK